MALTPTSHQFYPRTTRFIDSYQSSVVNKLHVTNRLQFLRYGGYSIPFKNQILCSRNESTSIPPQKRSNFDGERRSKKWGFASEEKISRNESSINSDSIPHQNPPKRSNFVEERRNKRMGFASEGKNSKSSVASSVNLSGNSWMDKWNDSHKQNYNKLKGSSQVVVNYRNNGEDSGSDGEDSNSSSSGSTMDRIVEKLKKFGYVVDDEDEKKKEEEERVIEKGSIEEIFYIEEGILPNARGGFSEKSPFGDENAFSRKEEVRFPWEKPEVKEEEEGNKYSVKQKIRTSMAELTLPESELRRLKNLTIRIKNKMRIGGSGVTGEVVENIHEKWKSSEVVRLKIEGAPALNMRRMHEILERKTGGLVIWRSGTSIALYRGVGYQVPSERLNKMVYNKTDIPHNPTLLAADSSVDQLSEDNPSSNTHSAQTEIASAGEENTEVEPEVKYEDEVDKLLDGLGPRYTDWPGAGPLPVDADLLPGLIPGYKPPFRILPYGVRPTLGFREATALKKLARFLPPHFALGRSRQHQGLATAMVKLWERSSIAKVALKRGVQLTTSERMAEDIKKLTGCILLSRNKDFLVFFRGKDFLSPEVAEALLEKENLAKTLQDEEEKARLRASALVTPGMKITDESGTAGTLGETLDADARWGKKLDESHKEKVMREAEISRHANLVRKLEKKLFIAERKIMNAERALSKVEESLIPADRPADPDSITDEERFMFRKLGLRMKAFLLLGRRGVFDGTVENMHLHWKYRELVKIIVKVKRFEEVKSIALSLESESGGVLVSVDKVSKGYAVIVFRGKNYERPPALRPKNLLTKRKALARSIELQRREALLNHLSRLQKGVDDLRSEIEQMARVREHGDEELYNRLDSAYSTEDEDSEDEGEGDDAYIETYDSNSDLLEESDELSHGQHLNYSFDTDDSSKTEHVLS